MSAYERLEKIAQQNMESRFVDNPCRGFVMGRNGTHSVQLSWIMGRSENSQNRIYVVDGDTVKTQAADPSKVKDPSLIIYNAMRVSGDPRVVIPKHIVSNGDQTDTVWDLFEDNPEHWTPPCEKFSKALRERHCEPDAPIFTPRITGYSSTGNIGDMMYVSILKADPFARAKWVEATKLCLPGAYGSMEQHHAAMRSETGLDVKAFPTVRQTFELPTLPFGLGYCVTTYAPGDSKNLPSFEGEPFVVPTDDTLEGLMKRFWNKLDERWRVAVAGKEIYEDGLHRIAEPINKHGGK